MSCEMFDRLVVVHEVAATGSPGMAAVAQRDLVDLVAPLVEMIREGPGGGEATALAALNRVAELVAVNAELAAPLLDDDLETVREHLGMLSLLFSHAQDDLERQLDGDPTAAG